MLTVMPIGATQLGWYLYDQQTGFDFGMIVGDINSNLCCLVDV